LDIEKAKKYATVINSSAKNYLNLLDNLLTWAKTQTEEIKYTCKNLDLKPIVEESLMILYPAASHKKIELINSLSDNIVACADRNMLQTIIRNLVQNAIKFTDSGGRVEINAVALQDHIEISVSDNGVGITEEDKQKLFGSDLNFSMQGTENEGGSGLGLMLCKEFVEKHGGIIWVESQAGTGSKFVFTLPKSTKNSKQDQDKWSEPQ
jgi:two-component system, sensor histidine kinase and response regulator